MNEGDFIPQNSLRMDFCTMSSGKKQDLHIYLTSAGTGGNVTCIITEVLDRAACHSNRAFGPLSYSNLG